MNKCPPTTSRRNRHGFTLIETATAMMIISVAVVAMCELLTAGTSANIRGGELTRAVNLADTIHEIALGLPLDHAGRHVTGRFASVWDLNGQTFSPPIDGATTPIADYAGWTQQVTVQAVDNKSMATAVAADRSAAVARLSVVVWHNGQTVYSQSWLMPGDEPQ
ncbi:MAG TPA: prepilin-type N-terminal cleavage/methylation domain-containing protein [Tepidisphaeraceae bacterium]|jgi:prepilin-type N-terminal cleavage/methylation domain-containing protein|nr:prepilin-type N-terminal cleavage/methylation domain-containing protein [Tepidisphaeraceae bacterium]